MISISSAILHSIIIIPITYVKRQERIKKLEAIYSDGCCGVKLEKNDIEEKKVNFWIWLATPMLYVSYLYYSKESSQSQKSHLSRLSVKHVSLDQVQPKKSFREKYDTFRMYSRRSILKSWYSEQVRQTLFVHYIK